MILVAFGSSLPAGGAEPPEVVRAASRALAARIGSVTLSTIYRSPAWPDPSEPPFANAVAVVSTAAEPTDLLDALHAVEHAFGRSRSRPNAPRTLDLDLLDYDGRLRRPDSASPLALPHPRIAERDFVLAPLLDIAPLWRRPGDAAWGVSLRAALGDRGARPWVAVD